MPQKWSRIIKRLPLNNRASLVCKMFPLISTSTWLIRIHLSLHHFTNNTTVLITSIKSCKFICPYCLFIDCVMCTFYCDCPWYTGYTLEFQTQSQDTLKGKTLPSSSPNQTQETLEGKTLPRSRPIQIQDTLKGKTLPSSRLNQPQDSLKGKTLPWSRTNPTQQTIWLMP